MRASLAMVLLLAFARAAVAAPTVDPCPLLGAPLRSPTLQNPWRMATADFDEDGIPDLAVLPYTYAIVGVQRGLGAYAKGNGFFARETTYAAAPPFDLAIGDFDEDGVLDLAVAETAVRIWFGNGSGGVGDGTFANPVDNYAGVSAASIVSGDFNEDGVLDLAVGNGGGSSIAVMLGHGTNGVGDGTFAPGAIYTTTAYPRRLVPGDFNSDGRTDLVALEGGNAIGVLLGLGAGAKGSGGFSQGVTYVVGTTGYDLVTGDFNADGRTDIAFTETANGDVAVMLGNGAGTFGNGTFLAPVRYAVGTQPLSLGVADFNGDGIADFAVSCGGDSLAVLTGNGSPGAGNGTFTLAQRFLALPSMRTLRVGDFAGDTIPDVAVASADSAAILVFPGACRSAQPTYVSVVSPNGGEVLVPGTEATLSWTKGAGVIAVDVELSRDLGNNWEPIARNLTGTSFAWTVTPPATGSALLRVRDSTVPARQGVSGHTFYIESGATDVPAASVAGALGAPSPNPFASVVRVQLTAPREVQARVEVCGVDGRVVARLHDGVLAPGMHTLSWDGRGAGGRPAPAGIYFVRAAWPGFEATRRVARLP